MPEVAPLRPVVPTPTRESSAHIATATQFVGSAKRLPWIVAHAPKPQPAAALRNLYNPRVVPPLISVCIRVTGNGRPTASRLAETSP